MKKKRRQLIKYGPHRVLFLHQDQSQPFDLASSKFLLAYWNSLKKAYQHICKYARNYNIRDHLKPRTEKMKKMMKTIRYRSSPFSGS